MADLFLARVWELVRGQEEFLKGTCKIIRTDIWTTMTEGSVRN